MVSVCEECGSTGPFARTPECDTVCEACGTVVGTDRIGAMEGYDGRARHQDVLSLHRTTLGRDGKGSHYSSLKKANDRLTAVSDQDARDISAKKRMRGVVGELVASMGVVVEEDFDGFVRGVVDLACVYGDRTKNAVDRDVLFACVAAMSCGAIETFEGVSKKIEAYYTDISGIVPPRVQRVMDSAPEFRRVEELASEGIVRVLVGTVDRSVLGKARVSAGRTAVAISSKQQGWCEKDAVAAFAALLAVRDVATALPAARPGTPDRGPSLEAFDECMMGIVSGAYVDLKTPSLKTKNVNKTIESVLKAATGIVSADTLARGRSFLVVEETRRRSKGGDKRSANEGPGKDSILTPTTEKPPGTSEAGGQKRPSKRARVSSAPAAPPPLGEHPVRHQGIGSDRPCGASVCVTHREASGAAVAV